MKGDVFARIRSATAAVAARATQVRLDPDALEALALRLAPGAAPSPDPTHRPLGDAGATLAYVVTMDAVNFGSGWFPHLRKRAGLSGYMTLSSALRDHFERCGPLDARALTGLDAAACGDLFQQDLDAPERAELMALYARALRELGSWLLERHGGSFADAVAAADGRAARLVEQLAEMPLYRDVASYGGLEVPFYKRAQITCSDLAAAFSGTGPGRFRDLDRLTLFADNLVPHVLRREGALVYAPELARRIDGGALLAAGSPEEVEIRALAVCAVETLVAALARRGVERQARDLDHQLWAIGQRPEHKAHPRHRTRTPYY